MRIGRDEMFMKIAHVVAERGTCPRAKVGAVLVNKNGKIRGIGYNGAPAGEIHCEDVGCKMQDGHCKRAVHAEANAVDYLQFVKGLRVKEAEGYTMYVTHKPCAKCMPMLTSWFPYIQRVVYDVPYRYDGPSEFYEGGVKFEQYRSVHS